MSCEHGEKIYPNLIDGIAYLSFSQCIVVLQFITMHFEKGVKTKAIPQEKSQCSYFDKRTLGSPPPPSTKMHYVRLECDIVFRF